MKPVAKYFSTFLNFQLCYINISPTHGDRFQTNQPEHESMIVQVFSVCMKNIWYFICKFDQHLSLYCEFYCGSVKIKITDRTGKLVPILWESCEIQFPKFTYNCGTVSSKLHLKTVKIFIPLK